ncbi:MAG: cysteine desulfurase [Eubacterium sp.]|nr:cysteine desulfurase [Eubacterium sp.]
MEAYLDNSSTTKVLPLVKDIMVKCMEEDWGNPSAMHTKGVDAEGYVRAAREKIAATLKCSFSEIIFTSGGTESNNMAIIGTALAKRRQGKHIITTKIEHPSVGNVMKFLEGEGFEVSYLSVDKEGRIDLEELKSLIREDTILVSVMQVNNEVGAVEPIEEIGKIVKEKNPDCTFHVDAIQSYGKFIIRPKKAKIDLLSVSAHKIGGPKGVGFIYIKEKTKLNPIIFGGGQQDNMRSGTENVPGIAGLGVAAEEAYKDFDKKSEAFYALKENLEDKLSALEGVIINSPKGKEGAPHIVSASFKDIRSEVMLHALEEMGVFVSAGSACSSHKRAPSATLSSIGVDKSLLESTVRFSLNPYNTKEEIDYAVDKVSEVLEKYRKFTRK